MQLNRLSARVRWFFSVSLFFLLLMTTGCGAKVEVRAIKPHIGTIRHSFTEMSKTRLEDTYTVSMPLSGRIGRIELEPGDSVSKGQAIAAFDTVQLEGSLKEARAVLAELNAELEVRKDNRLEDTALVEANATIRAMEEVINASKAEVEAAKAIYERAKKELERQSALAKTSSTTQAELDDAVLAAETTLLGLRKQEFYFSAMKTFVFIVKLGPKYIEYYLGKKKLQQNVLMQKLQQTKARLGNLEYELSLAVVASPIDGIVLARYDRGGRFLAAGSPLVLVGDLGMIEVESEVLTTDAMGIVPGLLVEFTLAGRPEVIEGKVRRIEPAGFTKLSSLGVEQQRVKVFTSLGGIIDDLGVGFSVSARFITAVKENALIVPRFSVLQSPNGEYYVFRIVEGKLSRTVVELGISSDLEFEVTSGLKAGDIIVAEPDAQMEDGENVKMK